MGITPLEPPVAAPRRAGWLPPLAVCLAYAAFDGWAGSAALQHRLALPPGIGPARLALAALAVTAAIGLWTRGWWTRPVVLVWGAAAAVVAFVRAWTTTVPPLIPYVDLVAGPAVYVILAHWLLEYAPRADRRPAAGPRR